MPERTRGPAVLLSEVPGERPLPRSLEQLSVSAFWIHPKQPLPVPSPPPVSSLPPPTSRRTLMPLPWLWPPHSLQLLSALRDHEFSLERSSFPFRSGSSRLPAVSAPSPPLPRGCAGDGSGAVGSPGAAAKPPAALRGLKQLSPSPLPLPLLEPLPASPAADAPTELLGSLPSLRSSAPPPVAAAPAPPLPATAPGGPKLQAPWRPSVETVPRSPP
mmetsp:Transcript_47769/g.94263  ORF Transcript_47769/g.94263 Transcript_47769/m.94263 type:complete len:216 (-) Transcript_47769:160-807(-)